MSSASLNKHNQQRESKEGQNIAALIQGGEESGVQRIFKGNQLMMNE